MKGRLHLRLENDEGVVERRAGNAVMRGGGELIARLFSGKGAPITHMVVGTSGAEESETFSTAALTNGGGGEAGEALTGGTEIAIPADAFTIDVDATKRLVWVRLRVTVPGAVAVGTIREAGLVSRSGDAAVLYNRVTFAPVSKRSGDELTLFWEVSFPYGDVQWLM
jgi:hypothetical protein